MQLYKKARKDKEGPEFIPTGNISLAVVKVGKPLL
jgi:hypothetical protein